MNRLMARFVSLLLCLCCWFPLVGQTMPDDKNKIAQLNADFADLQQSKHQGEFKGNVELVQGTTRLYADRATINGDEANKLQLAIAYGSSTTQAHYLTQTDTNKPLLHAYADEIHYYPVKHRIDLLGNARVVQGNNVLSANKISYDTLEQRVISESSGKGRVTIVINPEK